MCHSGMVPTGPREARPDDRLRTRPGISRFGFALRAPRNDRVVYSADFDGRRAVAPFSSRKLRLTRASTKRSRI
jgi:hypothetical protein